MARSDFLVDASNALALATVENWHGWPAGKLLLVGPPGAGKTHLAQIWAAEVQAEIVAAGGLAGSDMAALAQSGRVVVEDACGLAGNLPGETALFHLHNMLAASGGHLLLTAATPPLVWPFGLPDLASRMLGTATVHLGAPGDPLLSAVLVKLFADRQIDVSPALIAYLAARMERSLAAAGDLVAALDALALARGRPVSRSLAAEVLDSLHQPKA